MNSKEISVKTERFYSAHHALLRIAKDNLHKQKPKSLVGLIVNLQPIALSALAIEAVCNAVGEKVIDKWCDFESCSPIVKIRLICEHLSINYDAGKEPWASVIWLCKTRNFIAHPKAEYVKNEAVITDQEHQTQEYRSIPKSKLEKKITFDYAKKSIATIEKLIDMFCEKLTVEQKFGIVGDMWHSSSKAHSVG